MLHSDLEVDLEYSQHLAQNLKQDIKNKTNKLQYQRREAHIQQGTLALQYPPEASTQLSPDFPYKRNFKGIYYLIITPSTCPVPFTERGLRHHFILNCLHKHYYFNM